MTSDGRISAAVKEKLRQKLLPLNLTEVLRSRIPFHDALLAELSDGHFNKAFDFFKQLIQYDLKETRVLTRDNKLMERIFNEKSGIRFK